MIMVNKNIINIDIEPGSKFYDFDRSTDNFILISNSNNMVLYTRRLFSVYIFGFNIRKYDK